MLLDTQSLFSDGQVIATATGDTASTNTLDWKNHGDDISRNIELFILCEAAGTFGTEGTLTISFQTSADNSTWTTLWTSAALTTLTAGKLVATLALPDGLKRYNRLVYTTGTAAFAVAPKFSAGIIPNGADRRLGTVD